MEPSPSRAPAADWSRPTSLLTLVALALSGLSVAPASAEHMLPTTVTITKVVDVFDDFDDLSDGDIYVKVAINGQFENGVARHVDDEEVIEPYWAFTRDVPGELATVPILIEVWEHEDCDHATSCSDDQLADASPGPERAVFLSVDRATGTWSGDTTTSCVEGNEDELRARLCFDISLMSTTGDADGDGLLDGWETVGYDADGDGTIDVDLPGFGADFMHKDLFVEFDWHAGAAPDRDEIQRLKEAFVLAPIDAGVNAHLRDDPDGNPGLASVPNPDGLPGINLWVDTGNLMEGGLLVGDDLGGGNQIADFEFCGVDDGDFYDAKEVNFASARRQVFRYGISGNPSIDDCDTGGQAEIGGNDFVEFNHDAGTIMHELGHTLNLHHGGHSDYNCKPNYISVMNYDHQFGIPQVGGGTILDYAAPRHALGRGLAPLPMLDEDNLDETMVLDPNDANNMIVFSDGMGRKVMSPVNQPVDWDGDGVITGGLKQVNIDDDGDGGPEACDNGGDEYKRFGSEDWSVITLHPRHFADFDDSAKTPDDDVVPTLQDLLALREAINSTDLEVEVSDAPDPAAAGGTVTYTVSMRNRGPNPANDPVLTVGLPAEATYLSDSGGCAHAGGTLACGLPHLLARDLWTVTITMAVPADIVHQAGGPVTMSMSANAMNGAWADLDPADNSATETTQVVAMADLVLSGVTLDGAVAQVLIGDTYALSLTVQASNEGPSSPMDALIEGGASASSGATIAPTSFSLPAPALAVGEQQTLEQEFTFSCESPGLHAFTLDMALRPEHPEDVELDPSDNDAIVSFVLDCVVPVALNVKPGSTLNPGNLGSRGTVPVGVLTTAAGEYGLPLAFDATRILGASARFGDADLVWQASGGSAAAKGKVHVEDTLEKDEQTKDGDKDGVLQFPTQGTGLDGADTEACVKGSFRGPANEVWSFFGCDVTYAVPA